MGHTPEPWANVKRGNSEVIVSGISERVHHVIAMGMSEQDARRIVACVNFCTGIPTNELELIASNERDKCMGLSRQHFDLHHVRKERDQLRLEYITSVGETQHALEQRDTYRDLCAELIRLARAKLESSNLNEHVKAKFELELAIIKSEKILNTEQPK